MDSGGVYSILIKVLIIILLIDINGFLTSIYTAVVSLNHKRLREKIQEDNDESARELLKISQNQSKLMQVHTFFDSFMDILTGVILLIFVRDYLLKVENTDGDFYKNLLILVVIILYVLRSEERRVGKECRAWWAQDVQEREG